MTSDIIPLQFRRTDQRLLTVISLLSFQKRRCFVELKCLMYCVCEVCFSGLLNIRQMLCHFPISLVCILCSMCILKEVAFCSIGFIEKSRSEENLFFQLIFSTLSECFSKCGTTPKMTKHF